MFGRMDMDELATPGYQVFSQATKIKLATMPKGELMVRHPHFTQAVFVRFPRPAVLSGPEGIKRFPPQVDISFQDAIVRQLTALDRSIAPAAVRDLIVDHHELDVRRAFLATKRTHPQDVLSYFTASLPKVVRREPTRRGNEPVTPLRVTDDPYAS